MIKPPFTHDPALTERFQAISVDLTQDHIDYSSLKAVVIGGGTGAPVSIRTLLKMGVQTSAVVAMADDGGSTGILREEAHVTPPGDIRKCLAAFAKDPNDPLTKAFKYRFEFARNHTLGNLMLSALENATGSFPEAIKICGRLLDAQGHVYPSTLNNITLCAKTKDGMILKGQANACKSPTALDVVWLESPEQCMPYMEALRAIRDADLIVLGPGSLFTSIIPNLLVPGIIDAISQSRAKTLFVCSLADQQGETWGLSALVHTVSKPSSARFATGSFEAIAGQGALNTRYSEERKGTPLKSKIQSVKVTQEDITQIQQQGIVVLLRNMVDPLRPTWHDPEALAQAFAGVFKLCLSQPKKKKSFLVLNLSVLTV